MTALIRIEGLGLRFGGLVALTEVSFSVAPGEIVSVIGPNGAGKTSLFNAITALHPPTTGAVLIDGRPLATRFGAGALARILLAGLATGVFAALSCDCLSLWDAAVTSHYVYQQPFPYSQALASLLHGLTHDALALGAGAVGAVVGALGALSAFQRARLVPERTVAAGIARTFQNIRLFQRLSALDNVRVALERPRWWRTLGELFALPGTGAARARAEAEALRLLERLGLAAVAGQAAGTLPYGHQRRLEIARALATRPRLLLLDEPAAGMNPAEAQELMQAIRAIREEGVAVLLIEHHMRVVMAISDRIVVLHYGHRIAEGTPHAVRQDPRVVDAYLGSAGT